jgi:hypothetical protein
VPSFIKLKIEAMSTPNSTGNYIVFSYYLPKTSPYYRVGWNKFHYGKIVRKFNESVVEVEVIAEIDEFGKTLTYLSNKRKQMCMIEHIATINEGFRTSDIELYHTLLNY